MDLHASCLVNSCQGTDARVLFRLNYLFTNILALDVIQVLDGSSELFSILLVNIVSCMFTATLFLGQRVYDWIV